MGSRSCTLKSISRQFQVLNYPRAQPPDSIIHIPIIKSSKLCRHGAGRHRVVSYKWFVVRAVISINRRTPLNHGPNGAIIKQAQSMNHPIFGWDGAGKQTERTVLRWPFSVSQVYESALVAPPFSTILPHLFKSNRSYYYASTILNNHLTTFPRNNFQLNGQISSKQEYAIS